MTKHIYIYLPKTRDAGFDESKHKRDHGKFASTAGAGTETHHSKLKPGDSLHDKTGQKIDHVESIGPSMRAGERTIHTRAGYQHQTKGGHLQNGMHAKTSSYSEKSPQVPQLSDRQAMLREMGSPRYSGASKPAAPVYGQARTGAISRAQADHAKRTGTALNSYQAAALVAKGK